MKYTRKEFTKEMKIVENFNGYNIVREVETWNRRVPFTEKVFYKECPIRQETYYFVCPIGEDWTKDKNFYAFCNYSIEGARGLVDQIIRGKIVLTNEERRKWVIKPNEKNGWGFSKKMLFALLKAYQKETNPRRKLAYVERLEDANFHEEAHLLSENDFEGFKNLLK